MMRRWILLLLGIGIAAYGTTALAHHSIAGVYDSSQSVTLECVVTKFEFVNPHPFLTVEVKDTSGKVGQWRLEMDNRRELAAVGIKDETLKPGDRIKVIGSLARRQPRSMYILKLERPSDGFTYHNNP